MAVQHVRSAEIEKEPSLPSVELEKTVDEHMGNDTRWEALVVIANRTHFEFMSGVKQKDVYIFYLWEMVSILDHLVKLLVYYDVLTPFCM